MHNWYSNWVGGEPDRLASQVGDFEYASLNKVWSKSSSSPVINREHHLIQHCVTTNSNCNSIEPTIVWKYRRTPQPSDLSPSTTELDLVRLVTSTAGKSILYFHLLTDNRKRSVSTKIVCRKLPAQILVLVLVILVPILVLSHPHCCEKIAKLCTNFS